MSIKLYGVCFGSVSWRLGSISSDGSFGPSSSAFFYFSGLLIPRRFIVIPMAGEKTWGGVVFFLDLYFLLIPVLRLSLDDVTYLMQLQGVQNKNSTPSVFFFFVSLRSCIPKL